MSGSCENGIVLVFASAETQYSRELEVFDVATKLAESDMLLSGYSA